MRTEDMEKQNKVVLNIKCIKISVHELPKVDYKTLIMAEVFINWNGASISWYQSTNYSNNKFLEQMPSCKYDLVHKTTVVQSIHL